MLAFFGMAHMGGPDALRAYYRGLAAPLTVWKPAQDGDIPDFMETT